MVPSPDQAPGTKPGMRCAGVQPRVAHVAHNPDRRSVTEHRSSLWDPRSAQGNDIASDEPGGFGGKVGDDVGHLVGSGDVEMGGTCRYAVTNLVCYPAGVCDGWMHHIRRNPEIG